MDFARTVVTGVRWQPYYDLHASTSDGKPSSEITLLYCANITQGTGEDWTDTVLTLSTANSQALRSLSVPVIDPLKVNPTRPPLPPPLPRVPMPKMALAPMQARRIVQLAEDPVIVDEDYDIDEGPSEDDFSAPPTSVNRNPLSLAYRVDGLVTLPSDGVSHKVPVAILDFFAELKYVCVPRKNTSTFIEGTVKNTSEYELLAGPVSVFMDDGFVTKTTLSVSVWPAPLWYYTTDSERP